MLKIKEIKRVIGAILSLIIMANIVAPMSIIAQSPTSKTYVHNGYTINYNIVNSWQESQKINFQQINVTIKNTGTEPIKDWKLYYDFCGEIEQIWSASVETDENGHKYINSMGWNSTIWAGSSKPI